MSSRWAKILALPVSAVIVCGWLFVFRFQQEQSLLSPGVSGVLPQVDSSTLPTAEIVVASRKFENTSWVNQYLPGTWTRSIYVSDDPSANLTVPRNKGREAMVYLTHLIERYDTLATTTVFFHANRFSWHNDDPDYDALPMFANMKLDYVQDNGYTSLRCAWAVGCPIQVYPYEQAGPVRYGSNSTDFPSNATAKEVFKQAFEEMMPGVKVPDAVGAGCCSQFAVSRERVHKRPKEDYLRLRTWLLETELDDELSGRVLEYMWHLIFGKQAFHCPKAGECYCKMYGLCNLSCNKDLCSGRYAVPPSPLPLGWPLVGFDDELRNFSGPL
ncbi:hypothetical protein B0T25DRAFT_553661 [Lasiosphaeria hispida]|uniref:Uncharacterized protein n=1 Tax=Lasiosphaeria hispida TaxID=260671 RepID=A0AAJ0HCN8_9PEZI|nr:hypothetical protein B0T25DRAFT_553661 [Lasiosphaeria hispida]